MTKRDVKVVQPGLVYVIEWDAGTEDGHAEAEDAKPASSAPEHAALQDIHAVENQRKLTRRERKLAEREKSAQPPATPSSEDPTTGPIYVA